MSQSQQALRFPHLILPMLAAGLMLAACNQKEKSETSAAGNITPPWDSPAFAPKRLDSLVYAGPESLFTVFPVIARLDSLMGDRKDWKIDPKALDTLRLAQLFDTGFVFPQTPEASMPYAYDESYRDDTLYRNAYGIGLFTQDHPCATTYVLSDQFLHPARWLKAGLTQADVVGALGRPTFWLGDTATAVLRYRSSHLEGVVPTEEESDSALNLGAAPTPIFEAANFYFLEDSLFAAVLLKSRPCH
jgi:hypothetical protein